MEKTLSLYNNFNHKMSTFVSNSVCTKSLVNKAAQICTTTYVGMINIVLEKKKKPSWIRTPGGNLEKPL